jgi:hypothetical protein
MPAKAESDYQWAGEKAGCPDRLARLNRAIGNQNWRTEVRLLKHQLTAKHVEACAKCL